VTCGAGARFLFTKYCKVQAGRLFPESSGTGREARGRRLRRKTMAMIEAGKDFLFLNARQQAALQWSDDDFDVLAHGVAVHPIHGYRR
jgi:hypothetical protein